MTPAKMIFHYFIISITLIICIAVLYWIFFHRTNLPVKRFFLDFIIPLGITIAAVVFILSPQSASYQGFQFRNRDLFRLIMFLAGTGIFIPVFCTIQLMQVVFNQKIELTSPSALSELKRGAYYTFSRVFAAKEQMHSYLSGSVAGKSSEYKRTSVFFVFPLFDAEEDTAGKKDVKIWTGGYCSRTLNRFGRNDKLPDFRDFKENCLQNIMKKEISQKTIFYEPQESGFKDIYLKAVESSGRNHGDIILLLLPLELSNNVILKRFLWAILTFAAGLLLWVIIVYLAGYIKME